MRQETVTAPGLHFGKTDPVSHEDSQSARLTIAQPA